MAAGEVEHPAVARGIVYLQQHQAEDGLWAEERYTATGFPAGLLSALPRLWEILPALGHGPLPQSDQGQYPRRAVRAVSAGPGFILTVSGLAREAAIAAGPGVRALAAGGPRLPALIEAAIADGAAGILSFGIAGGLDPTLPPGTAILAAAVVAGGERWAADPAWRDRLAARASRSTSRRSRRSRSAGL